MLFTGDAEREAQQVLLDTGRLQEVDVLKMPHHGGDTSLPELFPAVSPQVDRRSASANRIRTATRTRRRSQRRRSTGAEIWRTDEHGTLTITWDEQGDPLVSGER